MDLEFDASNVLYLIGAFLGAVTVLYFGASYVLELSPTTKSILLLSGFAFFFIEGYDLDSRDQMLANLSYVISGISYLVFLGYTSSRFGLTQEQILLLLGASSILFTALGYSVRERKLEMDHAVSRKVLTGLLIFAAALFAFDVAGAQAQYSLEVMDEVEISDGSTVIGTVEARNDFVFSRNLDFPDYSACVYTPNRTSGYIDHEGAENIIYGGESISANLTLDAVRRRPMENISGVYSVDMRDSCPEKMDSKIVVLEER